MDIGFIGLGAMGRAMAANLLKAGHTVRVWNRSRGAVEMLAKEGAIPVARARDAFRGDAVISMLADDIAVRAVILDERLLDAAPAGLVHVNMATVSVALARELAALHQAHDVAYVAAPVFGRPDVAAAGTLQIVAAGDEPSIERVQPLFDVMGQATWRIGQEPHQANVTKLAGNFMIASALESMAEAAAMAKGYGVAERDLLGVLTSTVFAVPVYRNYGALIAEQRYDPPGFKLKLGLKDVRLALAAGEAVSAPMPFASVLRDNLLDAVAHGDAERDWSAIANVAQRRAGRDRRT
ncbi:MAG TPA: NAD(P)-dependent oxidoreductase [Gemmatimonadaceae bacterium]|nr:NAD(P)-dependent oxidoreductase [Gemmatimonadaceae bacterium]